MRRLLIGPTGSPRSSRQMGHAVDVGATGELGARDAEPAATGQTLGALQGLRACFRLHAPTIGSGADSTRLR